MINLFNELNLEKMRGDNIHGDNIQLNQTGNNYITERKYLGEIEVDTVISYFNYVRDDNWNHSREELKIKFNAKFDSTTENIKAGELKVFKRLPRTKYMADGMCRISVYLIPSAGNQRILLDSLDIHARKSGWQTFNVTEAIRQWAQFPLTNHGLQLVAQNLTLAGEEVNPHTLGLVGMRGNQEKRPYLVAFANSARGFPTFNEELVASEVLSRERRFTRYTRSRRKRRGNGNKACHLRKFYINFRKIGYDKIIIAPRGYYMYLCQGTCLYPFSSGVKKTKHALIQSMAYLLDPDTTPHPCCAPDTLEPLSVLFYDDDQNIVLKKHAAMVATSCACQ